MKKWPKMKTTPLVVLILAGFFADLAPAQTVAPLATVVPPLPPVPKFRAVDADDHNILINKPGMITLLLCTSEDSQEAARGAGKAMYPIQGRPDFQLIVVVDLRDSIATWLPSVVLAKMRANMDAEAIQLKPYFLKNGNTSDPRKSSYVIADFNGVICPQLGWKDSSDDMRGILFGADGREIKRWEKIENNATDLNNLYADVHNAIQAYIDLNLAKAAATKNKLTPANHFLQPPVAPRPLPPLEPVPETN